MKSILELYEVSNYNPLSGHTLELLELFKDGFQRSEAMEQWLQTGRSADSFRQTVKRLKDGLLNEVCFDKEELSTIQKRRIECWEKYFKVRALLISEKKNAAVVIAEETIRFAKKCGITEIIQSCSLILQNHYGAISQDTRKYLRYRKLRKTYEEYLLLESKVASLYTKLIYQYLTKKQWKLLRKEIEEIQDQKTGTIKYIQFRCSLLSIWYQLLNENDKQLDILIETADFYEQSDSYIAFTGKTALYNRIANILIAQKKFAEADLFVTKSLRFPNTGSYIYQQLLFTRAILGLHSNKPKITLDSWERAVKYSSLDKRTKELWLIIRAYLAVYEKLGMVNIEKDRFRLKKFLNSVSICEQEKQETNVSIIIVTFLHYLVDGNYSEYMTKAEGLSQYIHKHLRGSGNLRSRSILYMLKKAEEADYYKLRTELRVGRWKKNLRYTPLHAVNFSEIMPYEKVWEIVLSKLK